MANKQLTAKVKLNITDVENKLRTLSLKIREVNTLLNKTASSSGVSRNIAKATTAAQKLKETTAKTSLAEQKLATETAKTAVQEERLKQAKLKTQQVQEKINDNTQQTSTALSAVEAITNSIHEENGKWKLDTEQLVNGIASLCGPAAGVVQAFSPIIAKFLEATGLTRILEKIINGIMKAVEKVGNAFKPLPVRIDEIQEKIKDWWEEQKKVAKETDKTDSLLDKVWNKLKGIASTYLGIMGVKSVISLSDNLTSAENRLNTLAAKTLGVDVAYNEDGKYSSNVYKFTQDAMDKMYVSAQKARTSYTDMMNNVSKNMTLAPKAFKNNIDYAIRFNEIMAESYAIGGASAAEMSSSMYQLTQALGAGVLAGDELRSVREGAPLAYQAIEEFAQGVLDTDESLKDLASQGQITSEMVVAAVMSMGDEVDKQFAQTKWTFGQLWDSIKNAASYAFRPVLGEISDAVQELVDNGAIQKIEDLFLNVAKGCSIGIGLIKDGINWIRDNWDEVKDMLVGGLIVIGSYFAVTGAIAAWEAMVSMAAWAAANWPLLLAVGILALLGWAYYKAGEDGADAAGIVAKALKYVGIALLVIGLLTGNLKTMVIGAFMMMASKIMSNMDESTGQAVGDIAYLGAKLWNFAVNAISWIANIGQRFSNMFRKATIEALKFQKFLNPTDQELWAENDKKIAEIEAKIKKPKELMKEYAELLVDPEEVRDKAAEIFSSKDNFNSWFGDMATDLGDGVVDWAKDKLGLDEVDAKLEELRKTDPTATWWDALAATLGIDFDAMFPTEEDLEKYIPDWDTITDAIDGIYDDTNKISDSMDLADEDLDYLRRIADMEWRNEFTTAEIKVDMTNYNTVNGDRDLDGIVEYLADVIHSEATNGSLGVHYSY